MNVGDTQCEELTVGNSALGMTASKYGTLNSAKITIAGANMSFKVDGGTATSTEGHILYDSDELELESHEEIVAFSAIRDDSTDVELSASYGVNR